MSMEILKTIYYDKWFRKLKDSKARAAINARLKRIAFIGKVVGDRKNVGDGVFELRFDTGPGYRIYCVQRGNVVLLLLTGGNKTSQKQDIKKAKLLAKDWKHEH